MHRNYFPPVYRRRLNIINPNNTVIINDNHAEIEAKPYDVCLKCPHIGKTCDGPNFLAMSIERWLEWVKERKTLMNLTNAQIAEVGNIGHGTVNRILAGHMVDLKLVTMRAITKAVINGTWGEYPCHSAEFIANSKELSEKERQELESLRQFSAISQADHERELNALREDYKEVKQNLKEKERRNSLLTRALVIFAAVVIAVLLYDVFNPTIGFVRY